MQNGVSTETLSGYSIGFLYQDLYKAANGEMPEVAFVNGIYVVNGKTKTKQEIIASINSLDLWIKQNEN